MIVYLIVELLQRL